MKLPFAPFILLVVLALLVVAPVSSGAESAPKELWDEFPLEQKTPEPSPEIAESPQATPAPASSPQSGDDGAGMPAASLALLLLGAAALGGAAVLTASRRLRPGEPAPEPAPAPAPRPATGRFKRHAEPVDEPAPAVNGHARADHGAEPRSARNGTPEPAAEAAGDPPPPHRDTPPAETTANGGKAKAKGGTPPKARAHGTPKPAAKTTRGRAGTPKPKGNAAPRRRAGATGDQAEPAAAPRSPKRGGTPPAKRAKRDRAVDKPPRAEPALEPVAPPPEPERPPRARPEPVPAPVPVPEVLAEAADETYPSCRIKLHNRPVRAHFYAIPYEGGPVLARSPYFTLQKAAGDSGPSAPDALRTLVEELNALGWRQTGVGSAPWDLRFQRGVRAGAAPRLSYSHSIVPGGLDVMSSTTRLTSRISPIIREAICSSRS